MTVRQLPSALMGEGAALTELAGVAEAPTESAYAWALDYDDYEVAARRFTPRRITDAALAGCLVLIALAGVVAVLGIRGVWHVEPVIVAAPSPTTTLAPTPVAEPAPITTTVAPTTVTVAAPPVTIQAPPAETIEPTAQTPIYVPAPMPVNYDQRLIYNLQAHGFTVSDAAAVVAQAHQACGMLQGGTPPQMVVDHFTGGPYDTTPADAASFVVTTMNTYPNCP